MGQWDTKPAKPIKSTATRIDMVAHYTKSNGTIDLIVGHNTTKRGEITREDTHCYPVHGYHAYRIRSIAPASGKGRERIRIIPRQQSDIRLA